MTRGGRDRLLADAQIALGPACLVYFPITRRDNPVTRRGQLEPPRVRGHRLEGGIAQLDELRARRRRDTARRCADGRGDEGVGDHGLPTAPPGAGTPPPPPTESTRWWRSALRTFSGDGTIVWRATWRARGMYLPPWQWPSSSAGMLSRWWTPANYPKCWTSQRKGTGGSTTSGRAPQGNG